jgi:hypothetical protein
MRESPKDATGLSAYLRRIAPALRAVGIDVNEQARTKRGKEMTIASIPDDVAGASPLSNFGVERRESGHPPPGTGGVNKSKHLATPATSQSENGRNAGHSAASDGVAGCSCDPDQLHRNSLNHGNDISPDGVAGVAVTGGLLTPARDPDERAAILEYYAGYPRPEAERLAGLQLDEGPDQ